VLCSTVRADVLPISTGDCGPTRGQEQHEIHLIGELHAEPGNSAPECRARWPAARVHSCVWAAPSNDDPISSPRTPAGLRRATMRAASAPPCADGIHEHEQTLTISLIIGLSLESVGGERIGREKIERQFPAPSVCPRLRRACPTQLRQVGGSWSRSGAAFRQRDRDAPAVSAEAPVSENGATPALPRESPCESRTIPRYEREPHAVC